MSKNITKIDCSKHILQYGVFSKHTLIVGRVPGKFKIPRYDIIIRTPDGIIQVVDFWGVELSRSKEQIPVDYQIPARGFQLKYKFGTEVNIAFGRVFHLSQLMDILSELFCVDRISLPYFNPDGSRFLHWWNPIYYTPYGPPHTNHNILLYGLPSTDQLSSIITSHCSIAYDGQIGIESDRTRECYTRDSGYTISARYAVILSKYISPVTEYMIEAGFNDNVIDYVAAALIRTMRDTPPRIPEPTVDRY